MMVNVREARFGGGEEEIEQHRTLLGSVCCCRRPNNTILLTTAVLSQSFAARERVDRIKIKNAKARRSTCPFYKILGENADDRLVGLRATTARRELYTHTLMKDLHYVEMCHAIC